MDFSFLDHPDWAEIPDEYKPKVLARHIDMQLESDPEFAEIPDDYKPKVRDAFIEQANQRQVEREDEKFQVEAEKARLDTPGIMGEFGRSIGRGVTQTLPKMAGQGIQWLNPDQGGIPAIEEVGKKIEQFGDKNVKRFPGLVMSKAAEEASNWNPRKWVASAGESIVQSAAPFAAGAAAGLVAGPIAGVAAGAATLGTLFYGGTAEDTYRRAKAKGLSDDDAMNLANITGGVEAGGEVVFDAIPIKVFSGLGKGAKGALIKTLTSRQAPKEMLKGALKVVGGEELTESAQQGIQAYAEQKYGTSDQGIFDSISEVWGPTLITSLVFAGGGVGYNTAHRAQIRKALTDPNVDPDTRLKAIQEVTGAVKELDPEIASNFETHALSLWKEAKPITLNDDDFYVPAPVSEEAPPQADELRTAPPVTSSPPVQPVQPPIDVTPIQSAGSVDEALQAFEAVMSTPRSRFPSPSDIDATLRARRQGVVAPEALQGEQAGFQPMGRPSTAQESAGVLQGVVEPPAMASAYAMQEQGVDSPYIPEIDDGMGVPSEIRPKDIKELSVESLQKARAAFAQRNRPDILRQIDAEIQNKTNQVPAHLRQIFEIMRGEVGSGQGNEGLKDLGDGGKPWVVGKASSNPEWFKQLGRDIAQDETNDLNGIDEDAFNRVLAKKEAGKELTPRQNTIWTAMQDAAEKYNRTHPDTVAAINDEQLKKNGFEPNYGQPVRLTDINVGDKLLFDGEEFEAKGFDRDGNMVFLDGEKITVDPFETVNPDGIKRTDKPGKAEIIREPIKSPGDIRGMVDTRREALKMEMERMKANRGGSRIAPQMTINAGGASELATGEKAPEAVKGVETGEKPATIQTGEMQNEKERQAQTLLTQTSPEASPGVSDETKPASDVEGEALKPDLPSVETDLQPSERAVDAPDAEVPKPGTLLTNGPDIGKFHLRDGKPMVRIEGKGSVPFTGEWVKPSEKVKGKLPVSVTGKKAVESDRYEKISFADEAGREWDAIVKRSLMSGAKIEGSLKEIVDRKKKTYERMGYKIEGRYAIKGNLPGAVQTDKQADKTYYEKLKQEYFKKHGNAPVSVRDFKNGIKTGEYKVDDLPSYKPAAESKQPSQSTPTTPSDARGEAQMDGRVRGEGSKSVVAREIDTKPVVDQKEGVGETQIETDPARIQEIKNSIAEGEAILKHKKKVSGKPYSASELALVRKSVNNSKARIGDAQKDKPDFLDKPKSPVRGKVSAESVRTAFKNVIETVNDQGDVSIVISANPSEIENANLREQVMAHEKESGRSVRGFFHQQTGTIYVFTDQMGSVKEAGNVLIHELIGHHGLYEFMGSDLQPFIDYINANPVYSKQVKATAKERGIDMATKAGRDQAVKEWFAELVEAGDIKPSLWSRFIVAFKNALRRWGFRTPFTDNDLAEIIRGAWKAAEGTGKRYSEAGMGQAAFDFKDVFHGTPHVWQPEPGFPHGRPRLDKIGTGEGAAAYGWGWYSAETEGVAGSYKQALRNDYDNVKIDGNPIDIDSLVNEAKGIIGDQRAKLETKEAIARIGRLGSVASALKEIDSLQQDPRIHEFPDVSWGLSKQKQLIESIKNRITTEGEIGSIYKLDLPDSVIPKLLDWDKPLSDQSEYVKKALEKAGVDFGKKETEEYLSRFTNKEALSLAKEMLSRTEESLTNQEAQKDWARLDELEPNIDHDAIHDIHSSIKALGTAQEYYDSLGDEQKASEYLASIGIPGNKYLDGMSRDKGAGSYNYVIWDQPTLDKIALLERNGEKLDAIRDAESNIDYKTEGHNIPQSLLDKLNAIHEKVDAFIFGRPDRIELNELQMPKELRGGGLGSKFMGVLTEYADEVGKPIYLAARGDFGGDQGKQQAFYRKHGFVENPDGEAYENMVRWPDGGVDYSDRAVTETKAFREWFGDSKVVDEDGKPLVAYHGSSAKSILAFDPSMAGTVQTSDWGKGIYFSTSKASADYYRETAIKRTSKKVQQSWDEYELAAKKMGTDPMNSAIDLGWGTEKYRELQKYENKWRDALKSVEEESGGAVYPAFIKMENPLYYTYSGVTDPYLSERALEKGHDGIIVKSQDGHIEEIVVFEPNQIKSITNANPTSDPRIDYSDSKRGKENRLIASSAHKLLKGFGKEGKQRRKGGEGSSQWRPGKPNVSWYDSIISLPMYYFDKVPQLAKAFGIVQDSRNTKYNLQRQLGYNEAGQSFSDLQKKFKRKHPKQFALVDKYLQHRNLYGEGYRIELSKDKEKELGKWKIIAPGKESFNGKVDAEWPVETRAFDTRAEASARMIELEGQHFMDLGGTAEAAKIMMTFRTMGSRMLAASTAELQRYIKEAEAAGLPEPQMVITDKDGRVKEVKLSVAIAMMGDLEGSYFPRRWKQGRYLLWATKDGEHKELHKFDMAIEFDGPNDWRKKIPLAINLKVRELEKKGYTITLEKSDQLPESVFLQASGQKVAVEQLVTKAMQNWASDTKRTLKDIGIDVKWKQNEDGTQDYIISGEGIAGKQYPEILEELGGKWNFVSTKTKGYPTITFKDATPETAEKVKEYLFDYRMMRAGIEASVATGIITEVADLFKSRGGMVGRIKRTGATGLDVVTGFEADPIVAFGQATMGLAGSMAKGIMAHELLKIQTGRTETWQEYKTRIENERPGPEDFGTVVKKAKYKDYIELCRERAIDPAKQTQAYKDLQTYTHDVLRNEEQLDRIMGTFQGAATLMFLAGKVSSAAINMSSLATSAIASMNGIAKIPLHKTPALLTNAIRAYGKYKFGKPENLNEWDKEVLLHIEKNGWDEQQFNHEAMSALQSKAGHAYQKLIEYAMLPFGITERINRVSTILGAYNGIKNMHKGEWTFENHEAALELAKETSDHAHGDYSKANRSMMTRGGTVGSNVARMALVFKMYAHNFVLNMVDLGFKRKQWKAVAYMAISPMVLAGAGAGALTPIMSAFLKAIGVGGDDPEEEFYRWLEENAGGTASNFARSGVVGMGGYGPSLTGSMELGLFEYPKTIGELFGAPGGVVKNIYDGVQEFSHGNMSKGLEKVLPSAIANPIKAIRESNEGLTTRKNTPIFYGKEQVKLNNWEAAMRALSFNPARIAMIREKQYSEKKTIAASRERLDEIYMSAKKVFLKPYGERSEGDIANIIAMMTEYNNWIKQDSVLSKAATPLTWKRIMAGIKRNTRPPKFEKSREINN